MRGYNQREDGSYTVEMSMENKTADQELDFSIDATALNGVPWSVCVALITFFNSNSKTRKMMKNNTYLLELMDEIFG